MTAEPVEDRELQARVGEFASRRTHTLAVARLDAEGTIVTANEPLQRLAGRNLVGVPVQELIAPAQRATLARALAQPAPGWQELLLGLFPDARGIPLDFSVALSRVSGGWVLVAEQVQATIAAVNERLLSINEELALAQRRIQQQRDELHRQNEQLLELDQLKDALLANVSHDLRTPLTAILGYAELMRRRGGLGDAHERATNVIERNARRLLRLVDDLLLLAQARAGSLEYARDPVDLATLVREASELARPLAAQGELRLEVDAPQEGEAIVNGDALRLGQLLDNLLANAVKFTGPGGTVEVAAGADDARVTLEVRDDGPGIPAQEQARLYEPFSRGGDTRATGAGLGLAIVREVAAGHGAELQLHSAPGEGTTFTLLFPRAVEP